MKKIPLFAMLIAIIILLGNCQSTKDTRTESSAPKETVVLKSTTSGDIVVSGSRTAKNKRKSTKSATRPTASTRSSAKTKTRDEYKPSDSDGRLSPREIVTTSSAGKSRSPKSPPPPPPPPTYSDKDVKKLEHKEGWSDAPDVSESLESESVVMDVVVMDAVAITTEEPPTKRSKKSRKAEATQAAPKARTLTAGEVNDFSKWDLWTDLSQEDLYEHAERWNILPEKRYAVQVSTEEGTPLVNCEVELQTKSGFTLWTTRTDNTGKAELWHHLFDKKDGAADKIVVKHANKSHSFKSINTFKKGVNTIQIPVACKKAEQQVDIAFVVDATGSMSDEIDYLKVELNDVIQRVKDDMPDTEINLGSVFYRDTGDNYLTRKSDFSNDISKTIDFIKKQNADAGGDYPEAVDAGLEVALNELKWSDKSTTRLMFLVLDAPPHTSKEVNDKMERLTKLAAQKGVRIIPVACSGIRKSTEYLMRALALATNGTYTFLTDHSGIGGSHIEPSTDEYKVELLNDLLVRIITQYSKIPDCDEQYTDIIDDINNGQQNHQIVWEYYPNPTKGKFTVQSDEDIQEVFITDLNGKLLLRRTAERSTNYQLDIGEFPSGVYIIKCRFENDKWESGRLVLVHER